MLYHCSAILIVVNIYMMTQVFSLFSWVEVDMKAPFFPQLVSFLSFAGILWDLMYMYFIATEDMLLCIFVLFSYQRASQKARLYHIIIYMEHYENHLWFRQTCHATFRFFFFFYIFLLKNYRNSKIYKSASCIPRGRIWKTAIQRTLMDLNVIFSI